MALTLPTAAQSASITDIDTVSTTPTVLEVGEDPRVLEVAVYTTSTAVEWACYTVGETPAYVPVPASVWTTIYRRPGGGPATLIATALVAVRSTSGTPTVAMAVS